MAHQQSLINKTKKKALVYKEGVTSCVTHCIEVANKEQANLNVKGSKNLDNLEKAAEKASKE